MLKSAPKSLFDQPAFFLKIEGDFTNTAFFDHNETVSSQRLKRLLSELSVLLL